VSDEGKTCDLKPMPERTGLLEPDSTEQQRSSGSISRRSTFRAMYETSEEIQALQALLDRSHARATEHLQAIIHDERLLSARDLVALLTGMKVLSVATTTSAGEPRISALDGHFLHGTWSFSTSGTAMKARHMRARPAVSVAHIDNEDLGVFSHGNVSDLSTADDERDETIAHWTKHYGGSPLDWGDDIRLYRYTPHWMVGYAFKRDQLMRDRGLPA
jgi:general stress protein 26